MTDVVAKHYNFQKKKIGIFRLGTGITINYAKCLKTHATVIRRHLILNEVAGLTYLSSKPTKSSISAGENELFKMLRMLCCDQILPGTTTPFAMMKDRILVWISPATPIGK